MAPVPISGGQLLYDTIDHAINAGKESLPPNDVVSGRGGRGGRVWRHLEHAYSDWSPPEPRLFEDANTHEVDEWAKFIESLFPVDSWFEGDSWPSDEDTFTRGGSLAEFEDTGDGVFGDTPNLPIPQGDWWDLPRASEPKNPMPLDYQKSSSSVITGRPEVPIDITTARDDIIVPRLRTRPKPSTYTTHDFSIWPREMIVPPTQHDPKRVVREYSDGDWFLTKRWGTKKYMRFIRYIMQLPY
ncbi:hypothetical protein Q9L58_002540 [Maublancomyces gigas]|uniref:Uncharacterized protein n=1 Tax=Discina gigas TaxID=1032678 RepID=A0ABR3GRN4_9PEZI